MTEKYAEKISMLMDDELLDHEAVNLIQGIEHDEWLKQCWERYHLISDALKNNLPNVIKHDLAKKLSRALESEQTFRLTHLKPQRSSRYLRPAVGLALAASVAVAAFLIVPLNNTPEVSPEISQVAVPRQEAALTPAVRDQMVATHQGDQSAVPPQVRELKVEPVLYDYLVDHNEYTDTTSVQSMMLPYVRIVGYSGTTNNTANGH